MECGGDVDEAKSVSEKRKSSVHVNDLYNAIGYQIHRFHP